MKIRKRHNCKNLKILKLRIDIVDDVFELLSEFPKD
jgi:hypothetical protein